MTLEPKVYLSRKLPAQGMSFLAENFSKVVVHDNPDVPPSRERLLQDVVGATAIIGLLTEKIDEEVLEAAGPQLKIVANVAAGYNNIDRAAAARRGIIVSNTPDVLDDATADLTFGLLLATVRRIAEADKFIRDGRTWVWGPQSFLGLDISRGATLGILGLGRTGMAVAKRAHAFNMNIIATGSRATSEEAQRYGVISVTQDELIRQSDVLSLHCPLTESNHHMFDAEEFSNMKQGSYLINAARGPLVNEEALADALDSGHLAGAGLDVHEFEPSVNERLKAMKNVVLLPHIGSAGEETRVEMSLLAIRNVVEVLNGRAAITPVTE